MIERNGEYMNKLTAFFESTFYPILVFIIFAVSWYFYLPIIAISVMILICGLVTVFKMKTEYLMPLFLNVMFVFRSYTSMEGTPILIWIAPLIVIALLITYIIRVKPNFMKTKLKLSFLFLAISSLISLIYLDTGGQITRYLLSALNVFLLFIYLFFASTGSKNNGTYLAKAFFGLGLLMSFQLFITGVTGSGFKEKITTLGWGGGNTLAIYINMSIIFTGYLMTLAKKAYVFFLYFLTILVFIAILLLTQSRTGYIAFAVCIIPCIILVIIKAKCRKSLIFGSIIGAILLTSLVYVFWSDVIDIFNLTFQDGINDSGRFQMWGYALARFANHPIIGNGLFSVDVINQTSPDRLAVLHNIIIQCLFSFGIVGVLALLYFWFEKYYMIITNLTTFKLFVILVSLSGFVHGIFDNTFYMGVYMVATCFILSVTEHDDIDHIMHLKKVETNVTIHLTE